ncbi:hypothetical protein APS56_08050 [Pseudalgibacter alginicilyticus]|uniref:Lipoyl-binding domain-containing protein n=1 Tax=Pseudalgibacter alginicilyticus TaxID=1736674 RepID=A0A0P0CG49_9FLAO|nr:biotin/lipoyl-containing protein [Pseudalgibacter alginicilyticus]ALJ05079.1 hypothetical protein APS56_08050 [Pseudalgibacter alginicilyticus]
MKNFTFKINENNYSAKILSHEDNIIDIEVNGTSYSVKMKEDIKTKKTPTFVRTPSKSSAEPVKIKSTSTKTTITAPIPGVVFILNVKVGDVIKENDQVMILEAMKMENSIAAEKGGTVTAVHVAVGQQVLQGDVMIEIE